MLQTARVIHLCAPSLNCLTSLAVINHAPSFPHSALRGRDLTLSSSPPRSRLCRARLDIGWKKIGRMKRGKGEGRAVESREPTMGDALVTHDGLRGHTAEKMYIHSDTAKDMAADRRGRKGVDWCFPMPRMLPPLLRYYYTCCFISHGTIFVLQRRASGAPLRDCISYDAGSSALSVFLSFFCFNFILMTVPFACCTCTCSRRLQRRMPLIAVILLYVPWGILMFTIIKIRFFFSYAQHRSYVQYIRAKCWEH